MLAAQHADSVIWRGYRTQQPRRALAAKPRNMAASGAALDGSWYRTAREKFPYFDPALGNPVFMENAGGSQVPACVADAVRHHMMFDNAQLGAGYSVSNRSTQVVADAHTAMEAFMGVQPGGGQVVLGGSSSGLLAQLAVMFVASGCLAAGHEVVVAESGHEANVGPWVRAAERAGATVRWWRADPGTARSPVDQLEALLSQRTRVVALCHVSNLLGGVVDVPAVMTMVRARAPEARVVADGVAYAPHRLVDVGAWGVDWYVVSCYKCWGPHMGAMYGSAAAFSQLAASGKAPNHYFIPADEAPYSWELGGASHEGCAGLVALRAYLQVLAGLTTGVGSSISTGLAQPAAEVGPSDSGAGAGNGVLPRSVVVAAYEAMAAMEGPLTEALGGYLSAHPRVRLVGPAAGSGEERVPTFSFVHESMSPPEVVAQLQARGFALRYGHMYAHRLVKALEGGLLARRGGVGEQGCDAAAAAAAGQPRDAPGVLGSVGHSPAHESRVVAEGVVRVSLLHYNTPEEVGALIAAMEEVL